MTEAYNDATRIKPSNRASDYEQNGYRADFGNTEYRNLQRHDSNADVPRSLSIEHIEDARPSK